MLELEQEKTKESPFHFEITVFKNDSLHFRIYPGRSIKAIWAKIHKQNIW